LFKKYFLAEHGGELTCNPSIWEVRQEDSEFRASLGYIVKSCYKKQKEKKRNFLIFPEKKHRLPSFLGLASVTWLLGQVCE
jgi:hypothetical protein